VPVLDFAQVEEAEPGSIVDRSGTDLAALLFTGGTTGRSKGVPLTHANLFWCGWAANQNAERFNVNTALVPLPLAHAYGLLVFCSGLHRHEGVRTILMRWFDPAGWLKLAEEHRVQFGALVPSMIQMLLGQPLEKADLSELTWIASGASPLGPDAVVTADELTEYAKRHLAATKYPREITIVPMVPLTSVGKLDRKKLREWIKG
jgi:long-chain acyl-CoA synthetase